MQKLKFSIVLLTLVLFSVGCDATPPEVSITTEVLEPSLEKPSDTECPYLLPFSSDLGEVKITQGNSGSTSHFEFPDFDLSYAVDFSLAANTAVLATRDGIVSKVNIGNGGCGGEDMKSDWLYVIIDHQDGQYSVYAHLDKIFVEKGQEVEQGYKIGSSGNSGWTNCTNHLHYQVQSKGTNVSSSIPLCFGEVDQIPNGKEQLIVTSENHEPFVVSSMELSKEETVEENIVNETMPEPLDRHSVTSTLDWLFYAIQSQYIDVFEEFLVFDGPYYTNSPVEGGQSKTKEEFITELSVRLSSNPQCELISSSNFYGNDLGSNFTIWTSGWYPEWEMNELCYAGCDPIDPPIRMSDVGLIFFFYESGWGLKSIMLADRDEVIEFIGDVSYSCDDFPPGQ